MLEAKGLSYQYIEVDTYKNPQEAGIRHGDWSCGESTVLMEYVRLLSRLHSINTDRTHSWRILVDHPYFPKAVLNCELIADFGAIT